MLTRTWFPPALAVLIAACAALAGWAYHRGHAEESRQRLAAIQEELLAAQRGATPVRTEPAQFAAMQAQLDELQRRLPPDSDLGDLLEPLSDELSRIRVREQEIATRPVTVDRQLVRTPVHLHFRSAALDAHRILAHLESSPRLVRIDQLRIEQGAGDEPPEVDIEFSAFSLRTSEAPSWTAKP